MPFDTNRLAFAQEHFTIIEIDLPSMASCTAKLDGTQFHTPPTCENAWDEIEYTTYYFATGNTPLEFGHPPTSAGLPGDVIVISDPINKVILSISEAATRLRPGKGLAVQGSLKVTMQDSDTDPGPVATTTDGTYLGKLNARNVMTNRDMRIKYFHVKASGIYGDDDAEVHHYISHDMANNGDGTWTFTAKDELHRLDKDTSQFPPPKSGSVRVAIGDGTNERLLGVDTTTDWLQFNLPYVVLVGEEFMAVDSVNDNQGINPELSVRVRGDDISQDGNLITKTIKEPHEVGDTVQFCIINQDATLAGDTRNIARFLRSILLLAGVPDSKIPLTDWLAEIAEWHPSALLHTIWFEPQKSNKAIEEILRNYLLDMWFEPKDDEIKLSAISVWKTTDIELSEGGEIDFNTIRIKTNDDLRLTRSFVYFNKPFKIHDDELANYVNLSFFADTTLEALGFWGEPKTREYPPSHVLDDGAADLLNQRTVARFGRTPIDYSWTSQERFLNFNVGDVVSITTPELQGANGLPEETRAQILKVQTVFDDLGRSYKINALTYEPAFASGTEFTIGANSSDVNIFILVGAPSQVVNVTILVDGVTISGATVGVPAMRAGPFASGSFIKIIYIDSAIQQGLGGKGGGGGTSTGIVIPPFSIVNGSGFNGADGEIAYDAEGVNTDIYLGGIIDTHTALGTFRAPGGGGGGEDGQGIDPNPVGGDGGGGGAGSAPGAGGVGGVASGGALGGGTDTDGVPGLVGDVIGNGGAAGGAGAGAGGDWGVAGSNGNGIGGAAGKGIIKGGAVVNIHTGGNTGRFTNGGGDTPDILD